MTPPPNDPADYRLETGEADSEVRKVLKDDKSSALAKYRALAVGRPGLWPLFKHEFITTALTLMPGALGLVLRQKLYGSIIGEMGRGVAIGRGVTLRHPHRIKIGRGVMIDDNCVLDAKGDGDVTLEIGDGAVIGRNTVLSCKGGTIRVGAGANISVNCTLLAESAMDIGEKVLIAGHSYLIAGGNHGIDRTDVPIVDQPVVHKGGLRVEPWAWIGSGATVLDGVTVGRGAVVAAGSVVHDSVPAHAIVGGIPAKVVRFRGSMADAMRVG
ncbi:MAG: acyltransferase [Planctomycetota bacterium]